MRVRKSRVEGLLSPVELADGRLDASGCGATEEHYIPKSSAGKAKRHRVRARSRFLRRTPREGAGSTSTFSSEIPRIRNVSETPNDGARVDVASARTCAPAVVSVGVSPACDYALCVSSRRGHLREARSKSSTSGRFTDDERGPRVLEGARSHPPRGAERGLSYATSDARSIVPRSCRSQPAESRKVHSQVHSHVALQWTRTAVILAGSLDPATCE